MLFGSSDSTGTCCGCGAGGAGQDLAVSAGWRGGRQRPGACMTVQLRMGPCVPWPGPVSSRGPGGGFAEPLAWHLLPKQAPWPGSVGWVVCRGCRGCYDLVTWIRCFSTPEQICRVAPVLSLAVTLSGHEAELPLLCYSPSGPNRATSRGVSPKHS